MKANRAWIITWDSNADERDGIRPDQVLTFLDARLGSDLVVKIMKALWVSHSKLYWRERLAYATKVKLSPTFIMKRNEIIYVGSKPRLVGRIVRKIEATDLADGGRVSWIEDRGNSALIEQSKLPHPR